MGCLLVLVQIMALIGTTEQRSQVPHTWPEAATRVDAGGDHPSHHGVQGFNSRKIFAVIHAKSYGAFSEWIRHNQKELNFQCIMR